MLEQKKKETAKYNKLIKTAEKDSDEDTKRFKDEKQAVIDGFDEKIEKVKELLTEEFQ